MSTNNGESTHNGEIRKILCGYPILSVAMNSGRVGCVCVRGGGGRGGWAFVFFLKHLL